MDIKKTNKQLESLSTIEILKWAYEVFPHEKIKISTSFGAEGIIIIDILKRFFDKINVFTIDTGRNFNETYEVWQEIIKKYNINIDSFSPDPNDLSNLIHKHGPNLMYSSIENRKNCCFVRKIKPMRKALEETKLWISGLRREQSEFRNNTDIISWNEQHELYKLCPLAKWTEDNVWDYIRNNHVPYNKLYDKGFQSIGCQPCSRHTRPAEEKRSNRWWWEDELNKECGIHIVDGKVKRKKNTPTWNI